jgi:hypothetical protein
VSINETLSRYENPIACSGFFRLKKIMPLQFRQGRVMGISRMLPPVIGGFFFAVSASSPVRIPFHACMRQGRRAAE